MHLLIYNAFRHFYERRYWKVDPILFLFCFYIKTFEKVFTLKLSQCLQAPKKYG